MLHSDWLGLGPVPPLKPEEETASLIDTLGLNSASKIWALLPGGEKKKKKDVIELE